MSNYRVYATDPKLEISAGWDPMLNTFFAHVVDTTKAEDEEGRDVLWVGCTRNEILESDKIMDALRPYTEHALDKMVTTFDRDDT